MIHYFTKMSRGKREQLAKLDRKHLHIYVGVSPKFMSAVIDEPNVRVAIWHKGDWILFSKYTFTKV